MIKDNQQLLNRLHVVLDGIVIILSYALAYLLQFHLIGKPIDPFSMKYYMSALLLILPESLLLNGIFHLYIPKRVTGRRLEAGNVIKANVMGALIVILVLYLGHNNNFSRLFLFYFSLINSILLIIERNIVRGVLIRLRKSGFNQKHIIIVGYSRAAERFIDRVAANQQWGYQIRGILDDNVERGAEYKNIRVIGTIENLKELLSFNRLDEIIITLGLSEYSKLENIVACCEKSGVHTKFIPDYNNMIPTKPYTEDLLGLPVIHIRHVPLTNGFNKFIKRSTDIIGSIMAIILFSPVMLVTAIGIKLSSPGPLIYRQERVGLHNRTFMMYKFRSMAVQKPSDEKSKWTTPDDPRVTNIGKFIRKTSIDELPQLFNVLKGDMSMVGPRPERPFFVEKFKEEIPRYMVKHQVRPGMTGWAQVNGYRGDTSIRKRIDHDLYYIENWTIGFDLKILFLTVFKGFINKNAY
ncbi:MAG: undecaprenyl-phosphate glucose phosphotransferase [Lachnospiraceae bacterium]